ncbi:DUF916 domain-containing protein [Agromyces protaetiae]|uniref:DUF916 domain-containing protein n=1 Tax=Agromyces protaetiae TaxID=2509455 RepID=A0A4P6FAP3_9MICO|nr:DUF916 domain-containing protein [Agromyces protaetiae]QAY72874.1 DUF916 domain-containing protein [Agromyces protaetiae]
MPRRSWSRPVLAAAVTPVVAAALAVSAFVSPTAAVAESAGAPGASAVRSPVSPVSHVTTAASAETAGTATGDVAWTVRTVDNANGSGRPNFTYDVDPGAVIDDALLVTNTGTVPLDLAVYAADTFTTPTGDIDILQNAADSVDAGAWIAPGSDTVHLEPGAAAEVPFRIDVPADARPGDHSAGLVTALAETGAGTGTIAVERRLGSRLHLRVSGELVPAATVTDVRTSFNGTWNPFGTGTLVVDYRLSNTGNTRVTATEAARIAGPFGILAVSAADVQLPEVLPGSTIEVHREITGVPVLGWITGALTVAPEGVGLGAGALDVSTIEVGQAAVPWTFLALAVVIAGLVVAIVLVVRKRRGVARGAVDGTESASAA